MPRRWRIPPDNSCGKRRSNPCSFTRRRTEVNFGLPLQPGKSQHFQRQRNIFLDRAPRKQHCILEHQADLMRFACRIDGLTVDGHRTGTGTYQSGDHSEYGRFSAAARPEEADKFLVADRQLDLFERMDLPPAGIEYFGNVGQRDDRLARLRAGNIIDPNAVRRCSPARGTTLHPDPASSRKNRAGVRHTYSGFGPPTLHAHGVFISTSERRSRESSRPSAKCSPRTPICACRSSSLDHAPSS